MSKIVTIHQPQYLPWVPYFDKILRSDCFVSLDNVQFQKNGVQNRNQIKTPQGALWLTVPVAHSFGQLILDTKISNGKIIKKHLKTIKLNYSKAPYFDEIWPLIEPSLSSGFESLSDLNFEIIKEVLNYLEYKGEILKASNLECDGTGSDLVLNICKKVNASTYISGQGGKNYMDLSSFKEAEINVKFQKYGYKEYDQLYPKQGFISNLSIIDVLFNLGPKSKELILDGILDLEEVPT